MIKNMLTLRQNILKNRSKIKITPKISKDESKISLFNSDYKMRVYDDSSKNSNESSRKSAQKGSAVKYKISKILPIKTKNLPLNIETKNSLSSTPNLTKVANSLENLSKSKSPEVPNNQSILNLPLISDKIKKLTNEGKKRELTKEAFKTKPNVTPLKLRKIK